MDRVVVTGMGAVTPLATGKEEFWEGLKAGDSGIDKITFFDSEGFPSQIAGEVNDFVPTDFIGKKEVKRMDRFIQFAVAASRMALEDSSLEINDDNASQVGVSIGSGIGGLDSLEKNHTNLLERGPKRVSPFFIPMMIANMASGNVSIELGAKGPNLTVVTACATGTHAIGDSFKLLQQGYCDVMIAGGTEATVTPLAVAGFCAAKALSTRNDTPKEASRPFDKDRDGFVMGEGAGVLVLERLEHALERGAKIHGEILGFGMTGDAYHITAPDPKAEGAIECMKKALEDGNVSSQQIDYINAHGTSTKYNDVLETKAIKKVFGDGAYDVKISSTKSMTGHLLGAAGGVEAIATLLSIRDDFIAPTMNLNVPDDECDLDYVPGKGENHVIKIALSNSFGFGGTNATLLFSEFND